MTDQRISILHLSDIHFVGAKSKDENIVLSSFFSDIEKLENDGKLNVDCIIISGDLVKIGGDKSSFTAFKDTVIDRLCKITKCDVSNIFICPGNHDIDRSIVQETAWAEVGLLSSLKGRDQINAFIDKNRECDPSEKQFERLKNYYDFESELDSKSVVYGDRFIRIHKIHVGSISIGVACLNSAWRCTGLPDDVDKGNLIIGERNIDLAESHLQDCKIKIGVFHHPIEYLVESDRVSVESRISSVFDIVFFGHVHRVSPEFRKSVLGEGLSLQASCLYGGRSYYNGYAIIRLLTEEGHARVECREYSDRIRRFTPALGAVEDGVAQFPFACRASESDAPLSRLLRQVRPAISGLANRHITLASDGGGGLDMDTHFVCPPLLKGAAFSQKGERARLGVEDFLSQPVSVKIVGDHESGKTSIAHLIALRVARGGGDQPRLPLRANFTDLKQGTHRLWKIVRPYASEISEDTITRQIVEEYPTLILLDDVDPHDEARLNILSELMIEHPKARWIIFVNSSLLGSGGEHRLDSKWPDLISYKIGELPRSAIRTLSTSWATSQEDGHADQLFNSVIDQIERSGLPRSGYIVSLLLWTMKNKSKGEYLNEAVLLTNIIDHLLGRVDYKGALRSQFDFTSSTDLLQNFAFFIKGHNSESTRNEALNFIINYLEGRGLRFEADKLIDHYISCGILNEVGGIISFKYSRFQEFFISGYLRDEAKVMNFVLSQDDWTPYSRELDLYSARFRKYDELLEGIDLRLELFELPHCDMSDKDILLYIKNVNMSIINKQIAEMKSKELTAAAIDDLFDQAERRATKGVKKRSENDNQKDEKKYYSDAFLYYSNLEMYSIFVRNLEFTDVTIKALHLDRCLRAWSYSAKLIISALPNVFSDLRSGSVDIGFGLGQPEVAREKFFDALEGFLKANIPAIVADTATKYVASEKLAGIILDISKNEKDDILFKIMCLFILLNIDPETALEQLSNSVNEFETAAMAVLVSQRIFSYYKSHPLKGAVKQKFENLIARLELKIQGLSPSYKGSIIASVRKLAYDGPGSEK